MVRYIQDPFRVGAVCRGGALGVPWGRPGVVLVGALEMSWGRAPQDDPRTTPGHFGGALGMSWGALPSGLAFLRWVGWVVPSCRFRAQIV